MTKWSFKVFWNRIKGRLKEHYDEAKVMTQGEPTINFISELTLFPALGLMLIGSGISVIFTVIPACLGHLWTIIFSIPFFIAVLYLIGLGLWWLGYKIYELGIDQNT